MVSPTTLAFQKLLKWCQMDTLISHQISGILFQIPKFNKHASLNSCFSSTFFKTNNEKLLTDFFPLLCLPSLCIHTICLPYNNLISYIQQTLITTCDGSNKTIFFLFYSLFNVDRYTQFFSNINRQYTNKNRWNGVYQKKYHRILITC